MDIQNTELFIRAKSIFEAAITLPKEERLQYVIRTCGDDTPLRRYCEKLLHHVGGDHTFEEEFLETGCLDNQSGSLVGESIGHYRLNKSLGKGGMADVYAATRTDGVHDIQVALKLVRGWGNSSDLVSRFKQERKILASLKHPNIAQFLDGGVSRDERPYFVMEYVEGTWISEYCIQHRLGLEDRLYLFLKVCNVVAHAHQQLIIHRDIKPGNILVTEKKEVKLLDFGIAKILDDDLVDGSHQTVVGLPLTPQYSSPEQVLKQPLSTASDQYSLGVLLYELLTECSPYAIDKDSNNFNILRQVCEVQPERPSKKAKANIGLSVSNRRRYLTKLSGDLESIVLKTLEKKPGNRYDSVQHLAEDIQHFLNNKPIRARNNTWLYVTSKYTRRHWKGLTIAVYLIVFFAGQQVRLLQQQQRLIVQQQNLIEERNLAQQKSLESQQVQEFLTSLFKIASPRKATDHEVTVSDLLKTGVEKIENELNDQPLVKAYLLHTMGLVYSSMLKNGDALPLLQKALEYRRNNLPSGSLEIAHTLSALGGLEIENGNIDEALKYIEEAELIHIKNPSDPLEFSRVYNMRAGIHWHSGKFEAAVDNLKTSLELILKSDRPNNEELFIAYQNIGSCFLDMADYTAADQYYTKALEIALNTYGERNYGVAYIYKGIGLLNLRREQYDIALQYTEKFKSIVTDLIGEDNLAVADSLRDLTVIMIKLQKLDLAEEYILESLRIYESHVDETHYEMAITQTVYAEVLRLKNQLSKARTTINKSVELIEKWNPEIRLFLANAYVVKADILVASNHIEDAKSVLQDAYNIRLSILGQAHPDTIDAQSRLITLNEQMGKN